MLRVVARSKRGRKEIARHGDLWAAVATHSRVSCLGMRPGIKLMSIRDRATFWIQVEDDPNLACVDRLNPQGETMLPKNPDRTHLEFTVREKQDGDLPEDPRLVGLEERRVA